MSLVSWSGCFPGTFDSARVTSAASSLRQALGQPADVAFVFVSSDYLGSLEEFCEILRVDGHITDVVGCTTAQLAGDPDNLSTKSGFSVLALAAGRESFSTHTIGVEDLENDEEFGGLGGPAPSPANGWILLGDPYQFPADPWLQIWRDVYPDAPVAGGLASGGSEADSVAVFLNGNVVDGAVMVGLHGSIHLEVGVSQGCRPIGEPLTVTRAEDNVVYSLGAQPAYQVLESAFQTLSDNEKSTAKGNLLAGLASSEYVEDFKTGDFLIRNILGADPGSGAVVIGGVPRVGQTLQYQFRDCGAATEDWSRVLGGLKQKVAGESVAALLFSCIARGKGFFGHENHDFKAVKAIFHKHPLAGFHGNGEIGPVNGLNALHSYAASLALLYEKQ